MRTNYILFLLFTFVFFSCKKKNDDDPVPASASKHVTYRIACSDCEVIYYKSAMVQGTEYHVNSSWSYSFDGVKGDVVLLMAYNTSSAPQGVNATIMVNNDTLCTQTNYCPISGYSFLTNTLE